jgi:hypothetical protein
MSRNTMLAATKDFPRPPLYGIASCQVGTEFRDFEIGWDEVERDTDWATAVLRTAGLTKGDVAITTMTSWEDTWSAPVIDALRRLGVAYLPAEVFGWDAKRFVHFAQVLAPKAIIGLGAETLDGIAQCDADARELLSSIPMVWAREDAYPKLIELGVPAHSYVRLGPALALGLPGVGTVVNSAEWSVTSDDGRLIVSTAGERASTFRDIDTGIRGSVGRVTEHGVLVNFES